MLEFIASNYVDLGGWAFSGLVMCTVWIMILRGDVVPGSTARLWKESWETEREAGKHRDDQITKLIEGQRTTNKLISALQDAARDREP